MSFKFNTKPYIVGTGIGASISGNVLTLDFEGLHAAQFANTVEINGTAFDGSQDITTDKWGTARNISIADSTSTNTGTAVSVNGSAAATLKLPSKINATEFDAGTISGSHIMIDADDIQAYSGTTGTTLDINYYGGNVRTNNLVPRSAGTTTIGTSTSSWGHVYTDAITVNGRRIFMQSSTPSGASSGDIWIVTK